ncbi:MAG: transglutaminase-like domain-containing protein, partial [Planctomycetes bacterium]|nr:transglutaminase-like domain-containing protein [Planctomycetota bacterium]
MKAEPQIPADGPTPAGAGESRDRRSGTSVHTVRDAGRGLRSRTRLALAAAFVLFGVETGEPGAACAAAVLLIPLRSRWLGFLGRVNPALSFAFPAAVLLLVCGIRGEAATILPRCLGLGAALVLAAAFLRSRLAPVDHLLLIGGGILPVICGAVQADLLFLPLLAIWLFAALAAVSAAQAKFEEERVLDAARVRGEARTSAEEVGGRSPDAATEMGRGVAFLSFTGFAAGVLLALLLPAAVEAIGEAFAPVEVALPALPPVEIGPDGTPRFAIPEEEGCSMPFGPRLTREAFLRRLSSFGLTLLLRPADAGAVPGGTLLVRGECYDTLTSDGRWIRARAFERAVYDAEDGSADSAVTVGPGGPFVAEYVVPRGLDRTLYALSDAAEYRNVARVVRDGIGNFFAVGPAAPLQAFVVASEVREWSDEPLADPGPEFLLVPEGLRDLALSDASLAEGAGDSRAVEALAQTIRGRCVRLERDFAPGNAEETAPDRFDPAGFLLARRWGRNIDFATAFAVVLRNAGVPCRLATGYRDGTWVDDGGFYAFEASHTFAWVEIPVAGAGWVAVDPTPPALDVLGEERLAEVFEKPPEERPEEAERAARRKDEPGVLPGWARAVERFLLGLLPGALGRGPVGRALVWVVMLLVGALLIGIALAAGERGARLIRRAAGTAADGGPLPAFFERLVAALRRHGLRRRRAQTPLEFARGAFAVLGPGFETVRDVTVEFCAVRYGRASVAAERERVLLDRVAHLEAALAARREKRRRGAGAARALLVLALCALLAGAGPVDDAVGRLGDPNPMVRQAARQALVTAGAEALEALRGEISGVGARRQAEEIGSLIAGLDADDFRAREASERGLLSKGRTAVSALEEVLRSGSPEARRRAARVLAEIGELPPESAAAKAAGALRRRQALWLLGILGGAAEAEVVAAAGVSEPGLAAIAR